MEILTKEQTAEYLQVSLSQVDKYIERDENPLPCVQLSDRVKRIQKKDLEKWLNKNSLQGGGE